MFNRNILTAATLTASLGFGLGANAAITYVDAAEGASGNTFATGGSLADTSWVGPSVVSSLNDQWSKRAFANNGTVFQGWHSTGVPELTTQITDLSDGLYDVWVFFWDSTGGNFWGIDAGLESGDLSRYSFDGTGDTTSPVAAGTLDFTVTPMVTEGGTRTMYGVNLGQATVSGGSSINVFVDNLVSGNGDRAWYDGVGYEAVPEPGSLALLGLGGLLIARRRRNA